MSERGEPVLEVARLDVRPGREADFEGAFAQARPLIAASPGFLGVELRRCVEAGNRYLPFPVVEHYSGALAP
jgi:heme-degrading monooxygenase HmoA